MLIKKEDLISDTTDFLIIFVHNLNGISLSTPKVSRG